jgi:hypothetical protein
MMTGRAVDRRVTSIFTEEPDDCIFCNEQKANKMSHWMSFYYNAHIAKEREKLTLNVSKSFNDEAEPKTVYDIEPHEWINFAINSGFSKFVFSHAT